MRRLVGVWTVFRFLLFRSVVLIGRSLVFGRRLIVWRALLFMIRRGLWLVIRVSGCLWNVV